MKKYRAKCNESIGILGGTFDPIHLGHIHLAKEVMRQLQLDAVCFIPCCEQAHQKKITATPIQRLEMVKLALAAQTEKFYVDDREIQRGGVSYMFDTLQSLRQELPDAALGLIIGVDAFLRFNTWYRWREIFSLAHVIVADRGNVAQLPLEPDLSELVKDKIICKAKSLPEALNGSVLFLDIKSLPISATEIRALLKAGQSVKHLLPASVWQYIMQHKLYR